VERATLSIPQNEELDVYGTNIILNLKFDHTFYGFHKILSKDTRSQQRESYVPNYFDL